MAPTDVLDTTTFEQERPRLIAIAYRMLGSRADAEDVVQDAWLRWNALGAGGRAAIERPAAWLTTVVSRRALDRLRSAQREREQYVGPWLPEPVAAEPDPAESVELAESLTLGFLTVLERLTPLERAVFLLADVFGEPFAEVARVVESSEQACRQTASRARRRVRDARRHLVVGHNDADPLAMAFLHACTHGDVDALRRLLVDDVVLVSDGGALVHAARRPVVGFHRVSRLLLNLARRLPDGLVSTPQTINGEPGLVVRLDSQVVLVIALEIDAEGRGPAVRAVRMVLNPEKLHAVG